MARRADYIIIANAYTEGAGATDISDPCTRVFMTLLGSRHLKFRHQVYGNCQEHFHCLEIYLFLPRSVKQPASTQAIFADPPPLKIVK